MFISPTHGALDDAALKLRVSSFIEAKKKAPYRLIVGSDSHKLETGETGYNFVAVIAVHRVGEGGIYFWEKQTVKRRFALKERMYQEAILSLETAQKVAVLFKDNGISKYNIEIHVDIGRVGETREVIAEIVGMVRSSGYECKIKPDSYAASKVADRHA